MKLILTSEVAGLGGPGDVVEVNDGYGRNFLVPRRLAIAWTRGGERQISTIRRAREVREVRDLGHADEVRGRLEGLRVRLPVRSGENGRLYGAVTTGHIADAVKRAGGPDIDKRRIQIDQPIKTVGAHQVSVRVHPDVTAKLNVEIVAT